MNTVQPIGIQATIPISLKNDVNDVIQLLTRSNGALQTIFFSTLEHQDLGNHLGLVNRTITRIHNLLVNPPALSEGDFDWIQNSMASLKTVSEDLKYRLMEESKKLDKNIATSNFLLQKQREIARFSKLSHEFQIKDKKISLCYNNIIEVIQCTNSQRLLNSINELFPHKEDIEPKEILDFFIRTLCVIFSSSLENESKNISRSFANLIITFSDLCKNMDVIEGSPSGLGKVLTLLLTYSYEVNFPLGSNTLEKLCTVLVKSKAYLETTLPSKIPLEETPLIIAIKLELVELSMTLLQFNANAQAKNNNRDTPLHLVAGKKNMRKVLKKILDNNVDINAQNSRSETALHIAIHFDQLRNVKLLLSANPNLILKDCEDKTPLFVACEDPDFDILEAVVSHHVNTKISLNVPCNFGGLTPLHISLGENFDIESSKMLIKNGANFLLKNIDGHTPGYLYFRRYFGNIFFDKTSFVSFIKEIGSCDISEVFNSNERNQKLAVKEWLSERLDEDDCTALFFPLFLGYDDMVLKELVSLSEEQRETFYACIPSAADDMKLALATRSYKLNAEHFDKGTDLNKEKIVLSNEYFESANACLLKFLSDHSLNLSHTTHQALQSMLNKLQQKMHFKGLDEDEKMREQQYLKFCYYLVTALKNINSVDLKPFLDRLAEAADDCFPRWMEEVDFLCFAHDGIEETIPERFTVKDRVLGFLRKERIHLLSYKINQFDLDEVHERHYILNLFREELGTKLDVIDDTYAFDFVHPLSKEELRQKFDALYNEKTVVKMLFEHLKEQQKRTTKSKNPFDIPPQEVTDWLVDAYADSWKQDEYQKVPDLVKTIVEDSSKNKEVLDHLDSLGVSVRIEEKRISHSKLKLGVKRKISDVEQDQPQSVKRKIFYTNLKEAQKMNFLSEVFDDEGIFTLKAVVLLLESIKVLTQ